MATATQAPAPVSNPPTFPSGSLYVGDLHPDVNETQLFEIFKKVGPVASIRVCRDAITRRSLGYGYVNFHNYADAERGLDLLNYKEIAGRPCRIMWSQRDPSLRKSGSGNIFIKNLDKSIDNKALYDTFSAFGNILSCKVAMDERGGSLGYGFVHYDSHDAAVMSIAKVNGMSLCGKICFVGEFKSRKDRTHFEDIEGIKGPEPKWTNLYVKNFPKEFTEERIRQLFSPFGKITSIFFPKDDQNKTKGFAFINFESHNEASNAVDELNHKIFDGLEMYVGRAQKKQERERELRSTFDKLKRERMSKYQGVNLYVKNLDDAIDDQRLRQEFAQFGTITSAKVMTDDRGQSKGFGFVCFSSLDEASSAVSNMNNKMIMNKPIYVAIAQRKDQRRAQLEAQHAQRAAAFRGMQSGMGPMFPGPHPMFYPANRYMPHPAMARGGRFPPAPGRGFPPGPQSNYGIPNPAARGRGIRPKVRQDHQNPGQNYFKFTPNVRNPSMGEQAVSASIPDKQILGENLYAQISAFLMSKFSDDVQAGKITGMLLESMSPNELLQTSTNPNLLTERVNEALKILESHGLLKN